MTKRKLVTYENYEPYEGTPVSSEPSMTIPDQSMSLQEILHRYATGQHVAAPVQNELEPSEDQYVDLEHMDLAEVEDYVRSLKDEYTMLSERLTRAQEAEEAARSAARNAGKEPPQEPRNEAQKGGDKPA